MGFFANFAAWLNALLATYITDQTARIAGALEPAIITLGVIYVMVWGFLHLTGAIEEPFVAGIKKILTLALILGCALRGWMYTDVIVNTFFHAPGQLASVALARPDPFTGVVQPFDPVLTVDEIIHSGYDVAETLLAKAGLFHGNFSFYIAGDAVYIIVGLTAIYAIFLLSLAKIAMSILLALGPLFIALLFFESTKRFFESWLAQLANYALIAILTVMVAALMMTLLKASADEAVASGDGVTIAQAVRVCMTAGLAFLVLRQVMPMAAGLASGVALSSFNAISRGMTWAFGGAARRISHSSAQFTRGFVMDQETTRWDSLSRKAGFKVKEKLKKVRRPNSIAQPSRIGYSHPPM